MPPTASRPPTRTSTRLAHGARHPRRVRLRVPLQPRRRRELHLLRHRRRRERRGTRLRAGAARAPDRDGRGAAPTRPRRCSTSRSRWSPRRPAPMAPRSPTTRRPPTRLTARPPWAAPPRREATFPLGTTIVECSASDAAGNAAAGSFPVHVRDTTAPALDLPAALTREATGPDGAVVTYGASADGPRRRPRRRPLRARERHGPPPRAHDRGLLGPRPGRQRLRRLLRHRGRRQDAALDHHPRRPDRRGHLGLGRRPHLRRLRLRRRQRDRRGRVHPGLGHDPPGGRDDRVVPRDRREGERGLRRLHGDRDALRAAAGRVDPRRAEPRGLGRGDDGARDPPPSLCARGSRRRDGSPCDRRRHRRRR